ncbi:ABC transporter ATP-binding protein [Ferrimonas sediminicola]|uniref:ABC transporter ATP-binding protein n=1 Tax=Ferrimonas sediminicola TaxID=2569538 RepID=A0A4U1BG55_9GAMM|nr:ABC transporter ATP-binding protein [Ferrimonas sediminicola]TKB49410.1 ABC transporter ATP-binding protein [Ferrimonas sediminicola]
MTLMIEARGLTKRYGSKTALDGVDLNLAANGSIALVGPNGAGKTTLMSLICGYLHPTSGHLRVLGDAPGSPALLGRIGALPQDAQLDPGFGVGLQLAHFAALQGLDKPKQEARRVLELVQLAETYDSLPQALSHGMRKRVIIAQALIGQPELVLLDEPTAGLDPANARAVRELVNRLRGECRFIISSHNLEELQKMCDTVLHIDHGRISNQLTVDDAGQEGALTLTLAPGTEDQQSVLAQVTGVRQVTRRDREEYLIRYDLGGHPDFDLELLTALKAARIPYRRLALGLSLEERLFTPEQS